MLYTNQNLFDTLVQTTLKNTELKSTKPMMIEMVPRFTYYIPKYGKLTF